MIIKVTVSGGWAGLRSTCVIDTQSLPERDARQIEDAVRVCIEIGMPTAPSRARDARTYKVVAESDGDVRIVSFSEAVAPPEAISMLRVIRPICPQIG